MRTVPLTVEGVGAPRAVLPGDQLSPCFPQLRVLVVASFPVVELFAVGFLAAPQHRHGAPGFLYHLHDAVERLRRGKVGESRRTSSNSGH